MIVTLTVNRERLLRNGIIEDGPNLLPNMCDDAPKRGIGDLQQTREGCRVPE